jgi:hypothetical protein
MVRHSDQAKGQGAEEKGARAGKRGRGTGGIEEAAILTKEKKAVGIRLKR